MKPSIISRLRTKIRPDGSGNKKISGDNRPNIIPHYKPNNGLANEYVKMMENNQDRIREEFSSDLDTSDYFSQSQNNRNEMFQNSSGHFSHPMSSQGSSNSQRNNIEPESQSLLDVFNNKPSQGMFEEENYGLSYSVSQNQSAKSTQDNRLVVNQREGRLVDKNCFPNSSQGMFDSSQCLIDDESQSLFTLNGSQSMDYLRETQSKQSQTGYQSAMPRNESQLLMPLNRSQPFEHRNQHVIESQSLMQLNVDQRQPRQNEHQRITAWNQSSVPTYRVDKEPCSQVVKKINHGMMFTNRRGEEEILQTSNNSQSFADNSQSFFHQSSQSMLRDGQNQVETGRKEHDMSMRTGRHLVMNDSSTFERSRSMFSRPSSVDPIMQGNESYYY